MIELNVIFIFTIIVLACLLYSISILQVYEILSNPVFKYKKENVSHLLFPKKGFLVLMKCWTSICTKCRVSIVYSIIKGIVYTI